MIRLGSRGSAQYNRRLSTRRANTVREYLLGKGIPADRIDATGRGDADPDASNTSRAGRAQNRRVDSSVQAKQKM